MGALAFKDRGSVASVAAPRQTPDDDIAAMVIGGEIVMIDTSDFSVDGTSLCAVILWDGSIALQFPLTSGRTLGNAPAILGMASDPRTVGSTFMGARS